MGRGTEQGMWEVTQGFRVLVTFLSLNLHMFTNLETF